MNLNFNSLCPKDLAWLKPDQVVDMILNTFESKVISRDSVEKFDQITIESNWHILNAGDKYVKLRHSDNPEFLTKEFKIYFILFIPKMKYDQFLIIRGENLESFVEEIKLKNSDLTNDLIGDNSVILYRSDFCNICWSTYPIPADKECIIDNDRLHSMQSFASIDVSSDKKNFTYFSDLIIGSHLELFGNNGTNLEEVLGLINSTLTQ